MIWHKMAEHIFIEDKPASAALPLRSLFYGEGLFETFRYKSRLPVLFERHYDRMRRGAEHLGIPAPSLVHIAGLVDHAVAATGIPDAYVKICLLSEGSSLFYDYPSKSAVLTVVREYKAPSGPLTLHLSQVRKNRTSPLTGLKSLNYLENVLARREALAAGFNESLFLNDKDRIAECSAANISWIRGGALFTPSLDCGIMPGTTREILLEAAENVDLEVREGHYHLDSIYGCELALATNALIGLLPVSGIGDTRLDADTVLLDNLRTALFKRLRW